MLFQLRFFELFNIIHRSVKFLLMIAILFILFYYIKTIHQTSAIIDQSLMSTVNKFDDNINNLKDKLQYAVLIDAGSSGSRVYIYVWPPHSGDRRQLLKIRLLHDNLGHDVYHSISPGLSTCASNITSASAYIFPLLDFAASHIPVAKHKETPLYVLATAGMRLLDPSTQKAILDNLRTEIPKKFSFLFTPNNIQVITGKEEGIYSWTALNYLAGRFDHSLEKNPLITIENQNKHLTRMNTVSMIEMGGASIQIAFEITSNAQYERLKAHFSKKTFQEKIAEFNLGCTEHDTNHEYRLFVSTFLTLGANAARSNFIHYLIDRYTPTNTKQLSNLTTKEMILFDPCLPIDSSETINITNQWDNSSNTQYLYHLKGSGEFEQCHSMLKQVITKDAIKWCMNNTCPFNELKNLDVPFKDTDFYGLSEFWYSVNDIFRLGGKFDFNNFVQVSSKYCSTSWLVTQDRYKRKLYPNADFKRLLYQCFKSAWLLSILHDGFRMPDNYRSFQSVSTINGEPVQWTLGALIFRTRFFPLRTIDNQHGVTIEHVVNSSKANLYIQYILFALCMFAVVFFICIYLRRLQLMLNTNKPAYTNLQQEDITYRPFLEKNSIIINFD